MAQGSFVLPPLPFEAGALAGWLSQETLDFHHGVHHREFIEKLNNGVTAKRVNGLSLEDLVLTASGDLLHFASESWNHSFYWRSILPSLDRDPLKNLGFLKIRLIESFGSVESFLSDFRELALSQFGSGWIWVVEKEGKWRLQSLLTRNAENPLRRGFRPLLACDLWEHSYYIDYRNNRARYLDGFLRSLNWDFLAGNLRPGAVEQIDSISNKNTKKEKK